MPSSLTEAEPSVGSLRARSARAAFTSGGAEVTSRVAMVALTIVSARILEPREVGYLGAAVILVSVISVIGSFAETAAVTLARTTNSARVAFAATLIRAAAVGLLLVASVSVVQWLGTRTARVGADEVILLISLLSWTLLCDVLSTYPRVILLRNLDLDFIAVAQVLHLTVYVTFALGLLAHGDRARGLAIAQVIAGAASVAAVWLRFFYRRVPWSGWPTAADWRDTGGSALGLFVGLIGGFLCERVDNVMVATAIGTTAMSFYSMAWNASHTPASTFSRAINFVLVPTLPHLHDEPWRMQRALEECLRYSYLLLAPVCAFLLIAAPELVVVVLGHKWLPVVPCLRIMAVSALSAPILFASTALLVGTGRAILTSIATAIHLFLLVAIIPPVARRWGIVGAAFGELASVLVLTCVIWITAHSATGILNRRVLRTPVRLIAAATCAGVVGWLSRTLPMSEVMRLAVGGLSVMVGYVVFTAAFGERSAIAGFVDLVRTLRRRGVVALKT